MQAIQVALPQALIEQAQRRALGQVLTSWTYDDADGNQIDLSYDEVLDILRQPDNLFWLADDRIMVWQAFENSSGEFLAEHIEDLYNSYVELATDAVREERTETINIVTSSLDNPALQTVPSAMALRILIATLRSKDEQDAE